MKEEFFMKKRNVMIIIIAIAVIALAFSKLNKEEPEVESPINIEVGQVFTAIEFSQTKYVLNYKIADLNGDSVNDVVILVGEKESVEATQAKNVDVVFYDGALQKYSQADLKKLEGESPRLEMADVTGDSLPDIILILNTQEGDKTIRVITLEKESLKEIFKEKDNQYIRFTGKFVDGFKVSLSNRKLNVNQELDLSSNSDSYVQNKVFESSGKCIESDNNKLKTTGFVDMEFVQLTGCMGIKTKQRIVTADGKNIIEEISIIWKYEEGKWQIKEATGLKLGNLLY